MSVISIQTKKFADLEEILLAADSDVLLIHDGTGVKRISAANLKSDVKTLISAAQNTLNQITYPGAGAHNAIYRGKFLGSAATTAQYTAITSGDFTDLYIGDYWTIGGVNYRIAAFDYFYNCGDTNCTTHHAVIVPDTLLYSATMNATNITTGGYTGSLMYTTNLAQAKTIIKAAFSGHVLKHRELLVNAITADRASGWAWFDSEVELMNEVMVYGSVAFGQSSIGNGYNVATGNGQFPLFALRHDIIHNRQSWWLRDVCSGTYFALVTNGGNAHCYDASASLGVRPAFSIS